MFGKHQNFVGKVFLSSILKIVFKNYFIIFLKQKFLFWQLESLKHGIAGLYVLHEQGNLLELVDPILGSNNSEFGFLMHQPISHSQAKFRVFCSEHAPRQNRCPSTNSQEELNEQSLWEAVTGQPVSCLGILPRKPGARQHIERAMDLHRHNFNYI